MAELNNPDDKLFRAVFSRPEITAELILQCAPASLVEILDLDTLHLSNASFVDEEMKEHFADLVFSCKLKDGQPVVLPLVIEHKSYVPPFPPYQILRYQVQGWGRQIRDKEAPTPILPIIFYHGKEKWEVRPWKDYLAGMKPSLEIYTPAWSYIFIDLSEMPDERIKSFRNNFMKTVMLLMKHRREREFLLNHLGEIIIFVEETVETGSGRDDLLMIIRYLTAIAPLNKQELNEILTQRPTTKKAVMTIYETLIEEGCKKAQRKVCKKALNQLQEK